MRTPSKYAEFVFNHPFSCFSPFCAALVLVLFSSSISECLSFCLQDPVSRPQTSNSQRIYSPRVEGGSRLPRENNAATRTPTPPSQGPAYSIYRSSKTENHPLQQSFIPPSVESSNQPDTTPTRPQRNLERSVSNATVPEIDIQPPVSNPYILPTHTLSYAFVSSHNLPPTLQHRPVWISSFLHPIKVQLLS
jgi:hypothetical protein